MPPLKILWHFSSVKALMKWTSLPSQVELQLLILFPSNEWVTYINIFINYNVGAHTIGVARCVTFKQRLYNQKGNNQPDENLEKSFYFDLKTMCPKSGGDNFISPLDFGSPRMFDNTYFKLILRGKGLLNSDEVLLMGNVKETRELVKKYAQDESLFFEQFSMSMIKMGNLRPLIGFNGEVRKNCRRVN